MEPTPVEPTGKKILIIEDEVFIAEIYSRELSKAGFTVSTASDGLTGLEALEKDHYDLLLLDILLPNMHGLEVLRQWKVKHPIEKMAVLLLTNLGQDEVIKEAFALGANGFLIKASYTPKQVVSEVVNVLNGQPVGGTPQTPSPAAPQTAPVQAPPPSPDQPIILDQPTAPPVQTKSQSSSDV